MRYDVRLSIDYAYGNAAKDARHILRVRPREDRGQTLERVTVTVTPHPQEAATEPDFFGNPLDHLRLQTPHQRLSIVMEARLGVERGAFDPSVTPSIETVVQSAGESRDTGFDAPAHFLGRSRLVAPSERIGEYARTVLSKRRAHAADAVLDLAKAIRSDFRYEFGSTGIRTSPEAVFDARRGVCQDFAHLMISGLRGLGVPAGYASGFIRTEPPPGQARLEGVDAMHAWIEAWLGPDDGWIGFDPTNGCLARDDHIVVAFGRDYADVAPIDGVLMTGGPQSARHAVDVVPLDD